MRTRAQRRGEPLIVMSAIVLTWVAGRMAIWQAPDALPETAVRAPLSIPAAPELVRVNHFALKGAFGFAPAETGKLSFAGFAGGAPMGLVSQPALAPLTLVGMDWAARQIAPRPAAEHKAPERGSAPSHHGQSLPETSLHGTTLPSGPAPMPSLAPPPVGAAPPPPAPVRSQRPPERISAGHNLLWLAAVSQIPFSQLMSAGSPGSPASAAPLSPVANRSEARRWSGDGWVILRRGGGIGTPGAAFPSYGASQAGAVLRYRLAPDSAHRPALYLRGSAALNGSGAGSGEREVAAGFSARPVAALPVSLSAEVRGTRLGSGTRARAAAFAVTELPPARLPDGLRAEAYAQAGYVGGAFATGFVDGQVKLDRGLLSLGEGKGEARIGAGLWGGAQKGASRLDVGPSVTLGFKVGEGSGRLSADWRFRIAGDAAPKSGPALTLSAGF